MNEQLNLIEDVRLPLPDCYEDVVASIENLQSNNFDGIDEWFADERADDMSLYDSLLEGISSDEIEKCIKIYRERNGQII